MFYYSLKVKKRKKRKKQDRKRKKRKKKQRKKKAKIIKKNVLDHLQTHMIVNEIVLIHVILKTVMHVIVSEIVLIHVILKTVMMITIAEILPDLAREEGLLVGRLAAIATIAIVIDMSSLGQFKIEINNIQMNHVIRVRQTVVKGMMMITLIQGVLAVEIEGHLLIQTETETPKMISPIVLETPKPPLLPLRATQSIRQTRPQQLPQHPPISSLGFVKMENYKSKKKVKC